MQQNKIIQCQNVIALPRNFGAGVAGAGLILSVSDLAP